MIEKLREILGKIYNKRSQVIQLNEELRVLGKSEEVQLNCNYLAGMDYAIQQLKKLGVDMR